MAVPEDSANIFFGLRRETAPAPGRPRQRAARSFDKGPAIW
jgi:hypothetical protein